MMAEGFLTTHILDTAHGVPAHDVRIVLYRLEENSRIPIAEMRTNADGRTDRPILPQEAFVIGRYELEFHIGAYFAARVPNLPEPNFLNVIPVRFGISDACAHYHVPLLVSPYSFATYRGS